MKLTQFASEAKRRIYDRLRQGLPPGEGRFSEQQWKDGQAKGTPQMGSTTFAPHAIGIEFIYSASGTATTVLTVEIDVPERIVFMPVPKWVVESIWQGDIDGSYHFESDATALLSELSTSLEPANNAALFGPKQATRRE